MSSFRMAELALEAGMPPGVLNVITGFGHVTGPALSQHPGVGALVFTGGPDAGREAIRQTAANVIPVALELGGLPGLNLEPFARYLPTVLGNFDANGDADPAVSTYRGKGHCAPASIRVPVKCTEVLPQGGRNSVAVDTTSGP